MPQYKFRLRELREERGFKAKDIAAILNISYRNYQRYKKCEIDPPTSKTIFLADYFDVSVDYLLGRTDNPKINR